MGHFDIKGRKATAGRVARYVPHDDLGDVRRVEKALDVLDEGYDDSEDREAYRVHTGWRWAGHFGAE